MNKLLLTIFLLALPATTFAQTTTTNTLEFTGPKAGITAPGAKPVVIKDKAQIGKRLDLRGPLVNLKGDVKVKDTLRPTIDNAYNLGSSLFSWATLFVNNITLPEGGLVDGVDVSALATQVQSVDEDLSLVRSLPECDSGEIPMREGGNWVCEPLPESGEGTAYTAGNGLALNGSEFSMLGTSYDNVIVVAKSGGDFDTIQAAINSISDASNYNRYLIWVAPGQYIEQVTLQQHITLQGADKDSVFIGYFSEGAVEGVVTMANNSTLSNVQVQAASFSGAKGIVVPSTSVVNIENVDVDLVDAPPIAYAVYAEASSTVYIRNSELYVDDAFTEGYGIYSEGTFHLTDSRVSSTNGGNNYGIIHSDPSDENGNYSNIRNTQIIVDGQSNSTDCSGVISNGDNLELYIYNSRLDTIGCTGAMIAAQSLGGEINIYNSIAVSGDKVASALTGAVRFGTTGLVGDVEGLVSCLQSYSIIGAEVNDVCSPLL